MWKRWLIPGLSIILLTGLPGSLLLYPIYVNVIIGVTLFLGVFGLHTAYISTRCKDKQRAWLLMVMGLMSVLLAHLTLEGLNPLS